MRKLKQAEKGEAECCLYAGLVYYRYNKEQGNVSIK